MERFGDRRPGVAVAGRSVVAARRFIAAVALLLGASQPLAARQAAVEARVDSLFAKWDRPDSPGCALGVVRGGALLYTRGYGSAHLDYEVPLGPRSVFYMASVSKQFTAAAVVLLARDGKLSLDDDVRKYIPELPDYGAPITIRHLIHHTSGLRDYLGLMSLAGMRYEDVHPASEILELIARQEALNFAPGDEYLYSNTGYFLLARIVERVSGQSFREFTSERIFRPLGMTNTHFHTDPSHVQKNRAVSYQPDGAHGFRISFLANFAQAGSGGLYSTVEDVARWDENFYTPRIGGPGFVRQMLTRGVLNDGDTLDYAFGLRIDTYRGVRTVSHSGSMMGFKTALLRFPEQRFSVICLCNLGSIEPMELGHRVADLYLADRFPPQVATGGAGAEAGASGEDGAAGMQAMRPPPNLAALRAYIGTYESAELGATYRIALNGESLRLRTADGRDRKLRPTTGDAFEAGSLELHFTRDDAGRVTGFMLMAGRVRNLRFVRDEP